MEQDILTRVSNRLLEHIRQEMRNAFRDVKANITGVRNDISSIHIGSQWQVHTNKRLQSKPLLKLAEASLFSLLNTSL